MTVRGYIERLKNPMVYEIVENSKVVYHGGSVTEWMDSEVVDMEVVHTDTEVMRFYLKPVKVITVEDIINLCPRFIVLRLNNKDYLYEEAKEIPKQVLEFPVTAIKPFHREWMLLETAEP